MTRFFLLLLLFILCFEVHAQPIELEEKYDSLPLKDRWYLKKFCKDLLLHEQLGHVLFFETKPACLVSFLTRGPHIPPNTPFLTWDATGDRSHIVWNPFLNREHVKCWLAWKKYLHLLPTNRIVFCEDEVDLGDAGLALQITCINLRSLHICLDQYKHQFQRILGNDFEPAHFAAAVREERTLLSLINHDPYLLGLILGYGEESSSSFAQRSSMKTRFKASVPHRCKVWPVVFVGKSDSEEAQELTDRYSHELEEIWKKYCTTKDPLKLVLRALSEDQKETPLPPDTFLGHSSR